MTRHDAIDRIMRESPNTRHKVQAGWHRTPRHASSMSSRQRASLTPQQLRALRQAQMVDSMNAAPVRRTAADLAPIGDTNH